jgi:hypothetical protein
MGELLELVQTVGQCVLLRRHIAAVLSVSCSLDAALLHSSLLALNAGAMTDLRAHYRAPQAVPYPGLY